MITVEAIYNKNSTDNLPSSNQKCWLVTFNDSYWFLPSSGPFTHMETNIPVRTAPPNTIHTCMHMLHTENQDKTFLYSPTGGGGGQPCSSVPSEQSGCPSQRLDPRIQRVMSHINSPSAHSVNAHTSSESLLQLQRDT